MEPFFSPAVSLPVLMLHSAFSLSFHINSPVINIIPISNLLSVTKSGSKGSLFGGLTGAALMASAYYLMQSTETKAIGDALGFGSAFLFSCVFAYVVTTIGIRLAATRKPIPAGPLLGLSICALVVFTSAYLQDRL
ncbi:hypothetical protein Gorai_024300 [Gossypium raimondii]|uniref:Uncharacterized protein n=2 Tax=Gossypium TaxID=3633 RepID=A0A7J8NYQ2_GOSRA|nr:hypothetical protein [Gossypium raimondii]MBA0678133.1 hypothetical protein [Gossypium aridum]